jgi:hypothetical protein
MLTSALTRDEVRHLAANVGYPLDQLIKEGGMQS